MSVQMRILCLLRYAPMWHKSLCTFLGLEFAYWHLYVRLGVPGHVREVSFVLCCLLCGPCTWEPGRGVPGSLAGRALFLLVLFLL